MDDDASRYRRKKDPIECWFLYRDLMLFTLRIQESCNFNSLLVADLRIMHMYLVMISHRHSNATADSNSATIAQASHRLRTTTTRAQASQMLTSIRDYHIAPLWRCIMSTREA